MRGLKARAEKVTVTISKYIARLLFLKYRYINFRSRPDNAKLFYLLGERPHQAGRDRSRVRVVLQLSVAPAIIRVLPRGGRKGGREIVPGEDRARGGSRRRGNRRRRQGEPAES